MPFTQKDIELLKSRAKIRGYTITEVNRTGNVPVAKKDSKSSKAKDWIGWNLAYWCNQHAVSLELEYSFSPNRKFRFDWAIPSLKLAVEFEGGIFLKHGGHNTAKHYTKDTTKYNLAQQLGWKVLRFTAMNYKTLITTLNQTINNGS